LTRSMSHKESSHECYERTQPGCLGEGGQHVLILRPPLGSGAVAISLLRSLQGDDECQTSHRIDR
jgi:hypothetical protein